MATGPLDEHRARLEAWAEEQLAPYLKRLSRNRRPYETPKEFNDPIWGTLQLRPDEVVVLDSPILQRLRRVRQLGVVHLVYPAATHTRLEHSLGVVHQVQQLVTSINEHGFANSRNPEREGAPLSRSEERLLRLAALCHDIGHGAMSHVSEYSLDFDRRCEDIRLDFQRLHRRSAENQLSEIAAYYVLGSPAFGALLEELDRLCAPPPVEDMQGKLQSIVIGKAINSEALLLHELVSGPFDADKLDYLTRDARMCGVPVVADVPRLIQKVRVIRVDRVGLPRKLKRYAPDIGSGYLVTGIARSGARTLDEVALARTLMFDKVYRHQKVRAAEAMAFSLMDCLKVIYPHHPAMLPFALTDEELLALDERAILALAERPATSMTEEQRSAVAAATYLAQRLRDRRLFSRCFAFSAVMPRDEYRNVQEHREGLERLIADCGRPETALRFVDRITTLVLEICQSIGSPELADVPGHALRPFIWVSPPKPPPKTINGDTGHAYLIDENSLLVQAEEDTAETPGWADAYVSTRDLGYVFSLRRLQPMVYVAAEAVVRQDYGIRMPETMLAYAKQNRSRIEDLKQRLESSGWYDQRPLDLRPLPPVLARSDAADRVAEVTGNLAGYAGPYQLPDIGQKAPTSSITDKQVLSYVRQFVDDDLVDAALEVLSKIMVIGRKEANEALHAFLLRNPEFAGSSYCALGESRDSSALLTYYVGDVAKQNHLTQRSLADALGHGSPIIFVDDLVGRGSQSISIIEAWLGVEPTQRLSERRSEHLSPVLAEELRKHRVAFVFVAGMTEGRDALLARTRELELDARVYIHLPEEKLSFLDTALPDQETLRRFEEFCKSQAKPVLSGPNRAPEWVEDRLLGYGNRGLLLVSTYNTPTATLTCLWAEDKTKSNWSAFVRRRKKE